MGFKTWLPFLIFMSAIAGPALVLAVRESGDPGVVLAVIAACMVILPGPLIALGPREAPLRRRWMARLKLPDEVPLEEPIATESPGPLATRRSPGRLPGWLWSLLLWSAALIYLFVIVHRAVELSVTGRGSVVAAILIVFAPLPILFLVYRHRPDRGRANLRFQRARARLARRMPQED